MKIKAEVTIPRGPYANIKPQIEIEVPEGLKNKALVDYLDAEYGEKGTKLTPKVKRGSEASKWSLSEHLKGVQNTNITSTMKLRKVLTFNTILGLTLPKEYTNALGLNQGDYAEIYLRDRKVCTYLSPEEYINIMARAKIIWCPRTVRGTPNHEENSTSSKEYEAMCLGICIVKNPIGVAEVEKRLPGTHYAKIKNNNSDLIDVLNYYLDHDEEREKIAKNGRLWYERNASAQARAHRMFEDALSCIQ